MLRANLGDVVRDLNDALDDILKRVKWILSSVEELEKSYDTENDHLEDIKEYISDIQNGLEELIKQTR